jgi:hypothetical protein
VAQYILNINSEKTLNEDMLNDDPTVHRIFQMRPLPNLTFLYKFEVSLQMTYDHSTSTKEHKFSFIVGRIALYHFKFNVLTCCVCSPPSYFHKEKQAYGIMPMSLSLSLSLCLLTFKDGFS